MATAELRLPLEGLPEWEARGWRLKDVDSLVLHANNPAIARNLRDSFPNPYLPEHAREWILAARAASPPTTFAITFRDAAVGGIGLHPQKDIYRRSAEMGYWLGQEYWGRGAATAAARAVCAWGFRTLDLERIYAGVLEWNPASCRVLEKAGFTLEARLRRHVTKEGVTMDEFLYSRLRGE